MTDLLPPELWWKIISYVPAPSLCQVSLTCKYFWIITQDPHLWSHVKLKRDMVEKEGLQTMLDLPRLVKVQNIDLSFLDLTHEEEKNIRRVVQRFRRIILRYCQLTHGQLTQIMKMLQLKSDHTLDKLDLDSVSLSRVSDDDLRKALVNIRDVDLNNTELSLSQVNNLLDHITYSNIQHLTLSGQDLSHLSANMLSLPVCQVISLDVSNASLTEEQISTLLCSSIWSETIEELDLTGADLGDVSSQLMMDSVSCLTCLREGFKINFVFMKG